MYDSKLKLIYLMLIGNFRWFFAKTNLNLDIFYAGILFSYFSPYTIRKNFVSIQ